MTMGRREEATPAAMTIKCRGLRRRGHLTWPELMRGVGRRRRGGAQAMGGAGIRGHVGQRRADAHLLEPLPPRRLVRTLPPPRLRPRVLEASASRAYAEPRVRTSGRAGPSPALRRQPIRHGCL
jgi:hypothetical protein